jgi:hypothetical protein
MSDLKCPDCGGTVTVNNEWAECECCHFSCDTDKLENHTRPAPELPEGYREEHGDLWFEKDGQYLAWFSERTARVYLRNDSLEARHLQALAIWLQRRSK